jgi:hypothetical protein
MSSVAYSGQLELRPCNLLATRQGRGGAGSAGWRGRIVQLRAAKAGNNCPARTPSERGRDARPGQACRWLENEKQKMMNLHPWWFAGEPRWKIRKTPWCRG